MPRRECTSSPGMHILTMNAHSLYYALINLEFGPYAKIFVVVSCHNKYFPYGPNSRLTRALLYTHTSKTTKSQCFPMLLWTVIGFIGTRLIKPAKKPFNLRSRVRIEVRPTENDSTRLYKNGDISVVITCS